jgi:hypothetical protein
VLDLDLRAARQPRFFSCLLPIPVGFASFAGNPWMAGAIPVLPAFLSRTWRVSPMALAGTRRTVARLPLTRNSAVPAAIGMAEAGRAW